MFDVVCVDREHDSAVNRWDWDWHVRGKQSSQTSLNNFTSQLSRTCHFSFDVCLSHWGRALLPPPQAKSMPCIYHVELYNSDSEHLQCCGINQVNVATELCKSLTTTRIRNKHLEVV